MAWNREEASAVEGVWDMGEVATVEDRGNEESEHRADGVHRLVVKPPNEA